MVGLATACIAAVLLVLIAAPYTLLPALLGFAGTSIDGSISGPAPEWWTAPSGGFWHRWSRFVQRRPG